jgi:hypothetical protein
MELHICMIPSLEEPPWRSVDYHSELVALGQTLREDGVEIQSDGCPPGEWKVDLASALGSNLGAPVGSWLQARRGRTIRLKMGEIEADIRTVEELTRVIKIARCYQEVSESES